MPRDSQVWVTTHARELADAVAHRAGVAPVQLTKKEGATLIVGQRLVEPHPDEP